MSSTPSTAARRASPLRYIIMAVVAVAIAIAGYFAFAGQQRVPDATFTLLSGQKSLDRRPERQGLPRQLLGDELRNLHEGNAADGPDTITASRAEVSNSSPWR